jgi:hypothetical protein
MVPDAPWISPGIVENTIWSCPPSISKADYIPAVNSKASMFEKIKHPPDMEENTVEAFNS